MDAEYGPKTVRRGLPGVASVCRLAFIHNWDYHLTEIRIFADGSVDCWGVVDFEGFVRKVRDGWVVTRLPEGARVHIAPLGTFIVNDVFTEVPEEEFVKEVADVIARLQGKETSVDRCLDAWELFRQEPSNANRASLRVAYEATPEHLRDGLLSDQDLKDSPIRVAIYGV